VARVVLDTKVVVSACLTLEGADATIVELALLGTFTLYISPEGASGGTQTYHFGLAGLSGL